MIETLRAEVNSLTDKNKKLSIPRVLTQQTTAQFKNSNEMSGLLDMMNEMDSKFKDVEQQQNELIDPMQTFKP